MNNNGNVNAFETLGSDELIDFVAGPDSLVSFETTNAINTTGDDFGFLIAGTAVPFLSVYLPDDFVSGSSLSGAATFPDLTFDELSSLIGETRNLDVEGTFTVSFQSVPEPTLGWAVLFGGFVLFGQRGRS